MAIKSGRVGVRHDQVDHYGRIKNVVGGIFSNVSAGSLVSSSSAESSSVNTPSSFTGKIDLTSIKGNTIKWNQLVQNGNFADGTNNWEAGGQSTISSSNGELTVTVGGAWNNDVRQNVSLITGHKYLGIFKIRSDTLTNIGVSLGQFEAENNARFATTEVLSSTYQTVVGIAAITESTSVIRCSLIANASEYIGQSYVVKDINIFDLTHMFGAGNEPTTVEQFKSMFPLDYYEYDTGSLLPFKATALQNTFTGEEIHLPTLTYFPTGMKSADNVYDELTPVKATTRVIGVNLGYLNWEYISEIPIFQATVTGVTFTRGQDLPCDLYSNSGTMSSENMPNMTYQVLNNGSIWIKNTTYTSKESFKTAMNGVMLYCVLATPIETDIDVDFNLSLNVNEGENLQLLPLGTDTPASAPLRASVTSYKSGATGNDVEKLLGSIAQVETSPATGNHSVGDYIMYNYQLYKVTASITTGGSLVVGTNITATTVMDEFNTL